MGAAEGVVTAAFTLAGTSVGALGSYLVTLTQERGRHQQSRADRVERLVVIRIGHYTELVKQIDLLTDAIRAVGEFPKPAAIPADVLKNYQASWDRTVQAVAAVEVVGPADVAAKARDLYGSVGDNSTLIDKWIAGARWLKSTQEQFDANDQRRTTTRGEFMVAARAVTDMALLDPANATPQAPQHSG